MDTDPSSLAGWLPLAWGVAWKTLTDILPILGVLLFFQLIVLRRKLPNVPRLIVGFLCAIAGLTLFLIGLEKALFPLGRMMAAQLTAPSFLGLDPGEEARWWNYGWVYVFAAAIGFATTLAEPSLIAVGLKAQEVSGGAIKANGLRLAVASGVAVGVGLGTLRIVLDVPLHWIVIAGYLLVVVQTTLAPRAIIPLAYDSGGVTTSTVTVPLTTALGLGLANGIPGRSAMIDGFGLIALASLFPMITVMGYAQIGAVVQQRTKARATAKSAQKKGLHK